MFAVEAIGGRVQYDLALCLGNTRLVLVEPASSEDYIVVRVELSNESVELFEVTSYIQVYLSNIYNI